MGAVYAAFDRQMHQKVALKRLLALEDAKPWRLEALFESEYRNLVQLAHPGIVRAYDYGVDREGPFYTMELLSGEDLLARRPESVVEACAVARDIASALSLIHTRGLVHRDLSPANVRFTQEGHTKLIDFGALVPFGPQKLIVGTPAFVAPECFKTTSGLDQRTDLYALGALLYWLVTRRHARYARTLLELRDILEQPLLPPSALAANVPPALEELILSLLRLDPLARPGSAAEVMDRLTSIADLAPEEDRARIALSYLAHPPLCGREDLLDELLEPYRDQRSRGVAYLIRGNPGLGRSALLSRLSLGARLRGATVLSVEARAQRGAFGVARALVRGALFALADRASWLQEQHAEILQMCAPELADDSPPKSGEREAAPSERHARVLASMHRVLLELSALGPVCVVVDDVHRADQESQGLLAALAHLSENRPLSLYVSYRSGCGFGDAHAETKLREVARERTLAPLDEAQLLELTQALFGRVANAHHLGRFVHQSSGGVPLRAIELFRLLVESGSAQYELGTFNLPSHVDRAVGRLDLDAAFVERLAALSSAERGMAELLCLYEDAVPLPKLRELSRFSAQVSVEALKALTAQGLVVATGDAFAFAHDGVRTLFERSVPASRRAAVNLAAARVLLARAGRDLDDVWQAALFLMRGGQELEGARLVREVATQLDDIAEARAELSRGLVQALEVLTVRGESDVSCAPILVRLSIAGFLDDSRLVAPYLRRAFDALLELSGVGLAQRAQRLLPGKLALVFGLAVARVRFSLRPRRQRFATFRELLSLLFAVVAAGAAAGSARLDPALIDHMVVRLGPFGVLPPHHPASLVISFCVGTYALLRGEHARAVRCFLGLSERLQSAEVEGRMHEELRTRMRIGAYYGYGFSATMSASPVVPTLADRMDALAREFHRPHAEFLRYLHHALRGEQRRAEEHRALAEVLSVRGGSAWSALHGMAYRSILVCQWTRDASGLLRALHDMDRFLEVAPAMRTFRDLAQAYLELLRGRAEQAAAIYERVFADGERLPNLCTERGRYAEALNALGRSGEAKQICEEALRDVADEDLPFRFMYQSTAQELAISEALLGDLDAARARLAALSAVPIENPLLMGSLFRDQARVALLARDEEAFLAAYLEMSARFRQTQHPSLIQQCQQLWEEAVRVALVESASSDARKALLSSTIRSTSLPDSDMSTEALPATRVETPMDTEILEPTQKEGAEP